MYASFSLAGRLAALADASEGRLRRKTDEAVVLAERFLSGDSESKTILPAFATLWLNGSQDRAGNEGAVLLATIQSLQTVGSWTVAEATWSDSERAIVVSRNPLEGQWKVGQRAWMAGAWLPNPTATLQDPPTANGPVLVLGFWCADQ